MIVDEYSISIKPKIPDAEKIRYKIRPTTTGGRLISVFTKIIIKDLP